MNTRCRGRAQAGHGLCGQGQNVLIGLIAGVCFALPTSGGGVSSVPRPPAQRLLLGRWWGLVRDTTDRGRGDIGFN